MRELVGYKFVAADEKVVLKWIKKGWELLGPPIAVSHYGGGVGDTVYQAIVKYKAGDAVPSDNSNS